MPKYGLTEKGPNIKKVGVIYNEIADELTAKWGVNVRKNTQSFLNVLVTNFADKLAELWEFGEDVYFASYPGSAEGINLDNVVQYGGITRGIAQKSYYKILCTGNDGTIIPSGTLVATSTQPEIFLSNSSNYTISKSGFSKIEICLSVPIVVDEDITLTIDGNTLHTYHYDASKSVQENMNDMSVVIDDYGFKCRAGDESIFIEAEDETSSHSVIMSSNITSKKVSSVFNFGTEENGDIKVQSGTITKIKMSVVGLDSIRDVGEYTKGQLQETDKELRKSYWETIFSRSKSMIESIKSAILKNVQGVDYVSVYENDTNITDEMGRPPHSVEVVASGGDTQAIAREILASKAGGISTYGEIEEVLPGNYGEDITIRFNRPSVVDVWVQIRVTISRDENPPLNLNDIIQETVVKLINDLGVGADVTPQKFLQSIYSEISGVDYLDITMETGSEHPEGSYTKRSIPISAREIAKTEIGKIEVILSNG